MPATGLATTTAARCTAQALASAPRKEVPGRQSNHRAVGLRRAPPAEPDVERAADNQGERGSDGIRPRHQRLDYPAHGRAQTASAAIPEVERRGIGEHSRVARSGMGRLEDSTLENGISKSETKKNRCTPLLRGWVHMREFQSTRDTRPQSIEPAFKQ